MTLFFGSTCRLRHDGDGTTWKLKSNICGIPGALAAVIAASVPGATVLALCELGDKFIVEAAEKVYAKGKVPKGMSISS